MPRTFLRQDTQIFRSTVYDDALTPGVTLETGQTTIQGDLNALRSQVSRILCADGTLNWFDDVPAVGSKKRGLRDLNIDLDELEEQKTLRRGTHVTDVPVGSGDAYVILGVAAGQTPSFVAAVTPTTDGAVVAKSALSGGAFAAVELTEVSSSSPIAPKNLLVIRNAATGERIDSEGRDVYGLLQLESTGVDGAAFSDAGGRVKISFVRQNSGFDDLEACPAADVGGLSINYAYVIRSSFDALPEEAWLAGPGFVDTASATAAAAVGSLDDAVDLQSGAVSQTAKDINWRIDDGHKLAFQDSTGAADVLAIKPDAAGDELEFNGSVLDFNNVQPADFFAGARFDSGRAEILVGVLPGVIATPGGAELRLAGGSSLYLDDGNHASSSWTLPSGMKLSSSASDWNDFRTAFGETSLLKGIVESRRRPKVYALVTADVAANVDVGGAGGGTNLDTQLPDLSVGSFLTDYDVMINGETLRPGANATANHDYYPGSSLTNGQLRFEFDLKIGDQLCVIPYAR